MDIMNPGVAHWEIVPSRYVNHRMVLRNPFTISSDKLLLCWNLYQKYKNAARTHLHSLFSVPVSHIIEQQLFCFFAWATRISATAVSRGIGILTVEHLTLRTQSIALSHQVVNLLPSLQHTLNRLVQHNLSLVQFLLDLHNAIRLLRILVFHNIILQLWKTKCRTAIGPGGAGMLG